MYQNESLTGGLLNGAALGHAQALLGSYRLTQFEWLLTGQIVRTDISWLCTAGQSVSLWIFLGLAGPGLRETVLTLMLLANLAVTKMMQKN